MHHGLLWLNPLVLNVFRFDWNLISYLLCVWPFFSSHCNRHISDISRLEAKVERLEGQLQAKDRELATITRTVRNFDFYLRKLFLIYSSWIFLELLYQEAKATAAFKAQIEKLQQERDEFQRMVIGNQVNTFGFIWVLFCILELPYENGGILISMNVYMFCAKASEDSTNTWDEEKRKGVHKVAGSVIYTCILILYGESCLLHMFTEKNFCNLWFLLLTI